MTSWKTLASTVPFSARPWLEISRETVELPDGRVVDDFHQIWINDYVMILAETDEGEIVLERQYKHGVRNITLTFPGGAIEEGEDPLEAAKRELLEETGYSTEDWKQMRVLNVQANYGCGKAHFYHARKVRQTAPAASGDLEQIQVELHSFASLPKLVSSGEMVLLDCMAMVALATMQTDKADATLTATNGGR
ncbi:MAG: hydrolase [Prosthecobacter sp.]|nr:hydrolase [Prosthecobacter sp.]